MEYITRYWGKAKPATDEHPHWHPLAYHSLDVAAATQVLLKVRPAWLHTLAKLSGLPTEETEKRLILCAALHDLGKFAENFQIKAPEACQIPDFSNQMDNTAHGTVGCALWDLYHEDGVLNLMQLDSWIYASVSHHGSPVEKSCVLQNVISAQARADALAFTTACLDLIGTPSPEQTESKTYEHWLVAGLVILADWIGSNRDFFPYHAPTLSLNDYWEKTQNQAQQAMISCGLEEAKPVTTFYLKTFLPQADKPSPLQEWAEKQAPANTPQLYIIEDLTGSGKTEAALILAHRLMQAGAAEGIYWALPTMATANGLYERLEENYRKLFCESGCPPSLILAHSAKDLHDGFQLSIKQGAFHTYENTLAEAMCAAFIADDRKKTFLAQFGIGTLDQALLGALPSRHQSLRLAALSRRVLVIDEAHSFDSYTSRGLEQLLKFQYALGGSAIVLSATLTRSQRQKLTAAFGGKEEDITNTVFPLVTHAQQNKVMETPLPPARGTRRDLPYQRFNTPEAVMEALLEQARQGYCGVYIRNTVKEAMTAYAYLKERHEKVDIFHARFCMGDRLKREQAVLKRFGKNSSPAQRQGQILIATQVVEQSLDLDFDFMATDLCPMDLLIQRAGRLQRHNRLENRPKPELWIVSNPATDTAAKDWYAGLFPTAQYVYEDAGQLWRTMKVIEQASGLPLESSLPRALIEPVFGDGDELLPTPTALAESSIKATGKKEADRGMGNINFLNVAKGFSPTVDGWKNDVHTPTRLGETTLILRLAKWENGVLSPWATYKEAAKAWRLSEISIRANQFEQALYPDVAAEKAVQTVNADWKKRYDPPPILVVTPTAEEGVYAGVWLDKQQKERKFHYSAAKGLLLIEF